MCTRFIQQDLYLFIPEGPREERAAMAGVDQHEGLKCRPNSMVDPQPQFAHVNAVILVGEALGVAAKQVALAPFAVTVTAICEQEARPVAATGYLWEIGSEKESEILRCHVFVPENDDLVEQLHR